MDIKSNINNESEQTQQFSPAMPRPGFMRVISFIVTTFCIMMYYSFWPDPWVLGKIIFLGVIGIITIGVLITTIAPNLGNYGLRAIALCIFGAYFWYSITMVYSDFGGIFKPTRMSEPSSFNALFGLFIYGIPALIYALHRIPKNKPVSEKLLYEFFIFNRMNNIFVGAIITFFIIKILYYILK